MGGSFSGVMGTTLRSEAVGVGAVGGGAGGTHRGAAGGSVSRGGKPGWTVGGGMGAGTGGGSGGGSGGRVGMGLGARVVSGVVTEEKMSANWWRVACWVLESSAKGEAGAGWSKAWIS